jgi:hypothetical protein
MGSHAPDGFVSTERLGRMRLDHAGGARKGTWKWREKFTGLVTESLECPIHERSGLI